MNIDVLQDKSTTFKFINCRTILKGKINGKYKKNHYFIVINNPDDDQLNFDGIFCVSCCHGFSNQNNFFGDLENCNQNMILSVEKGDTNILELKYKTYINCDDVEFIDKEMILKKYLNNELEIAGYADESLINKIVQCVIDSSQIERGNKKIFREFYNQ